MEEKEKEMEGQFIGFVSMLSNSAFQNLGKFVNPITGKMDRNLMAAKGTIDLLSLLKEKTKGNLTKNEESVLSNSLANLQINYLDELKREEEERRKEAEKKEEKPKEVKKEKTKEEKEKEEKGEEKGKEEGKKPAT